jgi:hypothetical protein
MPGFWDVGGLAASAGSTGIVLWQGSPTMLLAQTQIELKPMFLGLAPKGFPGDDLMPKLRYCPAEREQTDAIPFPGTVSRIGRWQPRLAQDEGFDRRHDAEKAMDQVNEQLGRLADLLDMDDDRPRAA